MHRALARFGLALTVPLLWQVTAYAEPTPVTVRVLSQDAKFVGDGTGGAEVTLRDAQSGALLAQGMVRGGTGNTDRLMNGSGRSPLRATADAAAFTTTLDLTGPTLVELQVRGPLGRPLSAVQVSAQRWMLPGEPVTDGDGWVVELPGLAITPTATWVDGQWRITAKVEPMCGCPITPGGLWDSAHYQVTASLWRGTARVAQGALAFATSPGGYAGQLAAPGAGDFSLVVFARNTQTGATGLARLPLAPR